MFNFKAMGPIGLYRPAIAAVILVVVYAVMVSDLISRCLVAIIGSFVGLAVLAEFHGADAISEAMASIDTSTLALLFGLMVLGK